MFKKHKPQISQMNHLLTDYESADVCIILQFQY